MSTNSTKTVKGRISNKHGTEEYWILSVYKDKNNLTEENKHENPFIPLSGELIIYDPDSVNDPYRFKFGDGERNVVELPFVAHSPTEHLPVFPVNLSTENTIIDLIAALREKGIQEHIPCLITCDYEGDGSKKWSGSYIVDISDTWAGSLVTVNQWLDLTSLTNYATVTGGTQTIGETIEAGRAQLSTEDKTVVGAINELNANKLQADNISAEAISTTTLNAGSNATASATWDSTNKKINFTFGIPKGQDGTPGTPGTPGEPGEDGREVELYKSNTHIQWRYVGETAWRDLVSLADITGENGREIKLQKTTTHIQWSYAGDTTWTNLVALSDLKGVDGKQVQLQKGTSAIQWKYDTDTAWTNLVNLSDLKGANGSSAYWFVGTAVSGTSSSISATVTNSKTGDMYLNTTSYNVYTATAANTWKYVCNIKGTNATTTNTATANNANGTGGSNGLMSATDKTRLDSVWSVWEADGTDNTLVNKVQEIITIFNNYPEGDNLVTLLSGKVNTSDLPPDYVKIDLTTDNGTLTSDQLKTLKANPHKTVLNWKGYYCFAENLSSSGTYYYSANCTFNGTTSINKKVITLNTSSGTWSYSDYTYKNNNPTDYYWANVKISSASNETTVPKFGGAAIDGGPLYVKGTTGHREGIRLSQYGGLSSIWWNAEGIQDYTTGNMWGITAYSTSYTTDTSKVNTFRFRGPDSATATAATDQMWIDTSGLVTSRGGFAKSGGTSSQFLKADGSIDSNAYLTATGLSTTADVTTLAAGSSATASATWDATNKKIKFSFGVPKGQDGGSGSDGKSVELKRNGDYIQWRQTGGTWTNLLPLSDIKGDPGNGASLTKENIEAVLTGNITTHTHNYLSTANGGTVSNSVTVSGDLVANYLATNSAANETGTYDKIAIIASNNYIRYRTKDQLKSDLGISSSNYIVFPTVSNSSTSGNYYLPGVDPANKATVKYNEGIYLTAATGHLNTTTLGINTKTTLEYITDYDALVFKFS